MQAAANATEKLDKHRFLVQSKIVEDKDFAVIQELSSAQRSEEVSWVNICALRLLYLTGFAIAE